MTCLVTNLHSVWEQPLDGVWAMQLCSRSAVPAGASATLTCKERWRRPELRCRSQATTLLCRGVRRNIGHMPGCAVILCHLRHTRGTRLALREAMG
jgi:hypothetical protein